MKRVLVTRAEQQASAVAEALRARGLEPVLLPTVAIEPPTSWAAAELAVSQLASFDWVLFTSANAVQALWGRCGSLVEPLRQMRVAAIGQGTARALQLIGIERPLVPERAVAESLAEALEPECRRADGRPARMLLFRAEEGREVLPERLRAAGAEVVVAPVYRTVVAQESVGRVRELLGSRESWPQAATFTSGSTVVNLAALLAAAGVEMPLEILRISIGPVTSTALREVGWRVDGEAEEATIAALVEKVAALLAR